MAILSFCEVSFSKVKRRLVENRIENILWLVTLIPNLAGCSLDSKQKVNVPFWILTITLLIYVYGAGSITYQTQEAQIITDYIKSNFNVTELFFTFVNIHWFLTHRKLIFIVLKQIIQNDRLATGTQCLTKKYEKSLSVVKKIIIVFYSFVLIDAIFIYLPHRLDLSSASYCMTSCVGMSPLTESPYREICRLTVLVQELGLLIINCNYQTLLITFISHTATMYQLLAEEMLLIDAEFDENQYHIVKEKLSSLINRHVLTLDIMQNLQNLYSLPIGANFALNTVCIALFFYLPLREWIDYIPFLVYCFLSFFLYCYLGQNLIDASEMFERGVYACGWEKFQVKERKTVYTMLLQAQKPIQILAADIIPVNIYTFATTIQALYKFITVIKF